jgi:NodT family efflux transporter outer membrane factor (OMF) lipoprotein
MRLGLAAAFALVLAGCALTRVEPPPPVNAAPQFKETGPWQRAEAATPVPDAWWTVFADPVLDDLERRLVVGNENLKLVVAQVANARAIVDASRSAVFPTLSAGATGARGSTAPGQTSVGAGRPVNNVVVSASSTWEIDLWGRLAQGVTGAEASLQASVDDLAMARLSAQATLAQSYLSMRAAEAQLGVLARSVRAFQRSLELTRDRYALGVVARTDVLLAQTQLKTAQAQVAEASAQRAQFEHAIAVLLGEQPARFAIAPTGVLPPSVEVPALLPATLLERRPDIAAAQRRVAAAYAQIGIADAAFYPALTLSANAGYRGAALGGLIAAPNQFWSIGPALAQLIFDGGQRRLASAQARANADAATASYRQSVLTALQEVEDNLVLADQLRNETRDLEDALEAARRALEITLEQYRGGTVSYLAVVVAQAAALNSESNLLAVRSRQLAAVNQLLKNIAGRWDES